MITSDEEAYNIILNRIKCKNITDVEKNILCLAILLMEDYSFVKNQTYPRPLHPDSTKRKDAYFTLIAIILSLRTTLENEQKAVNLFLKKYNSIYDVANTDVTTLKDIISCAGMPQKKSQAILNITNYIIENYSGDINNINDGNISEIKDKLMKFPGVGEKSADCMLELAFNLPSIVVDINVFRVTSRLFYLGENLSFSNKNDVQFVKKFLEKNIVHDYKMFQILHTIFLLHGKYICKSKPQCKSCKLKGQCLYYKNNIKIDQLSLF